VKEDAMKLNWMQRALLIGQAVKGSLDVRPGSVVGSLLQGMWPSTSGEPPKRQGKQYLDSYGQMPWARAPVGRIATAISLLHWRLYYETKQGKPVRNRLWQEAATDVRKASISQGLRTGTAKEVEQHLLLDALHKGNMQLAGSAVWKVSQAHLDLVGETFWLKERNGAGAPVAYWPLPPHWVIDTPSVSSRFYQVSFRAWQGDIPDSEIVWFKDPDPANPYGRGSGTAQALADELESDEYAAKHVKQFFFNRAKPDFMVYPKGDMNVMGEDQAKALERKWLDNQQGFWRAFRPQFLSREVGIHEFTQNFSHLQLNELRAHSRDTALQTYGIPPEILGVIENSNRATIEGAFYAFQKLTVEPRAEFWRSELQQKVVPDYDPRLIIDYDSPVQEDRAFTLQTYQAKGSTVTIDEWRAIQGLPPIGGTEGDRHFQAINESIEENWEPTEDEPLPETVPPPAAVAAALSKLPDDDLVALYKIAEKIK
jgi:HK97 family phage portal protein